jgi:hypothetical protein
MKKIILVFRDSDKLVDNYELSWSILDTALANEWLDLLKKNVLQSDHPIEKTFCLKGWQTDWYSKKGRNLTYLCNCLNHHISIINKEMTKHGYPYIDLIFTVEKLKGKEYRDLMNGIHHHFELLIGQSWNVSKWYQLADEDTRFSIRMLNNFCHEIESIVKNLSSQKYKKIFSFFDHHAPMGISVGLNGLDFKGRYFESKIKKEITLDQYNDFQNQSCWGDIRIYYAQLGKSHLDAFDDKDGHIDKENISGYRYLTGEFCIALPGMFKTSHYPLGFKRWLKKNGYDINDKSLGIGYPIVATFDNPNNTKRKNIATELQKRDDLYQIRLEDQTGNVLESRIFNYYWFDQESN